MSGAACGIGSGSAAVASSSGAAGGAGHQVDMMIELGPQVIPHVRSGRLRVLATTSSTRTESMPDVPTLAESGVHGYDAFTWFALYAPAGVSNEIVTRINSALRATFDTPDVRARLASLGAEVAVTSPADLAAFQGAEARKWDAVIKRAGIVPE